MTVSEKQLTANRQNAKQGGVKTQEGKAVSRMNAMKHNVLGQHLMTDEKDALQGVLEAVTDEWQPVGFTEAMLVERIAIGYVRLARVTKAETEQLKQIHDPRVTRTEGLDLVPLGETVVVNEGYTAKVTERHVETLSNVYLRYETTIERGIYRAIYALQELQARRKRVDGGEET